MNEFAALLRAVPRDGILTVHSAFRGLSRAGYRAEIVIEAMLDHLADGTLVMPAMSWRIVTPENPIFDELATPSHVGSVAELFRTRYATARSLHPTHSVAAAGASARALMASHHLGTTPCAMNSPYGLMRSQAAYLLMLGCGFECCTAIHLPEEIVAPERYLVPLDQAVDYALRDRHGTRSMMRLRRHRPLNRCFEKFEVTLEAQGRLRRGVFGGTPYVLCALGDLLDVVFAALAVDRDATLAPDGVATRLSSGAANPNANAATTRP
jgi:aminoglycoside 3-N-acetyltransferase